MLPSLVQTCPPQYTTPSLRAPMVEEWSVYLFRVWDASLSYSVCMYIWLGSVVPFGNQPVGARKCYHIPPLLIKLTWSFTTWTLDHALLHVRWHKRSPLVRFWAQMLQLADCTTPAVIIPSYYRCMYVSWVLHWSTVTCLSCVEDSNTGWVDMALWGIYCNNTSSAQSMLLPDMMPSSPRAATTEWRWPCQFSRETGLCTTHAFSRQPLGWGVKQGGHVHTLTPFMCWQMYNWI